jgi:hypothetical protein
MLMGTKGEKTVSVPTVTIPSFEIPSGTAKLQQKGMSNATAPQVKPQVPVPEIDSALVAAMKDDRERVALWRLETTLCEFLDTNKNNTAGAWLEVGGPWNSIVVTDPTLNQKLSLKQQAPQAQHAGRQTSFQRCLVHRLADRFGIVRETGQVLEGSIRLIKLADSKIPVPLLQDLDLNAYSAASASAVSGVDSLSRQLASQTLQPKCTTNSKTNTTNTTSTNTNGTGSKPRKMKIMKRSSKSSGSLSSPRNLQTQTSSTSSGGGRRQSDFSEKEKAYAEARARIFSDESSSQTTGTGTNASASSSTANVQQQQPLQQMNGADTAASETNRSSNNSNNHQNNPSNSALPTSRSSSIDSRISGSNHGTFYGNHINNNNNAPALATSSSAAANIVPAVHVQQDNRKAVYRNFAQEAADPDFQRGAAAVVFQPAYYDYTSGVNAAANTFSGAGAVHATLQLQQQQQQHYGPYGMAAAASSPALPSTSYYNNATTNNHAATGSYAQAHAQGPTAYYHNPYASAAANAATWGNINASPNKAATDAAALPRR